MTVDPPPSTAPPARPTPRPRLSIPRPARTAPRRRLRPGQGYRLAAHVVLGLACAAIVMVAALAVGMRLDDRQIDGHHGTATATVISISALRTGIEFVDGAGVTIRPPKGVLYPGLLSVGQRFQVEYSTLDPTVVRVAGRTAAVGDLLLGITLGVTVVVAAPLIFFLHRRSRRAAARRQPAVAPPPSR
ncbi:hypothetical protein SAMN04515671_2481 [Nakamurella panacisegetis]|uniref:DUF3592 domain-containing protein n=1 Tax=Nakamurella panacisegetis TaxID=1090615 RepID=A0A1H0NU30_9ACTN|nr:DUF3592 domain-containing protein [Nakamurella panacisegetis]SDO95975.1 hypothetical protein SAMN04515671_2481 [Nakamurella panacisegetis]